MMKTIIFIIAFFFCQMALSQTFKKSSIDNGGASVSNANIQMVYSIGEVNVQEATVGALSISEGFIGSDILTKGIYIPDPNFEQALIDLEFDKDGIINKQISREDAEAVTSLDVHSKEINSLEGIQGFVNLKYLYCGYNPLGTLDVSGNTKLTTLICHYNELTELDISKNTQLEQLVCGKNQIVNLNVSHLKYLEWFHCDDNLIENLDVTGNLALTDLRCHNNQLTNLDVSMNAQLVFLDCSDNDISSLILLSNTELAQLRCKSNKIPELILTNNAKLFKLECTGNNLQELDLSANLLITELICMFNEINILEVSHLENLTRLFCTWNKISDLDLRYNHLLYQLECNYNELVTLDIRNGTNEIIDRFDATNNTDLSCISVDDELADYALWQVAAGAIFSNDCGYNTQRGEEVVVAPVDEVSESAPVDITFESVGLSGQTTIEITEGVENPGDFLFPEGQIVYNIETSAEFTGEIDICIDYSNMELASEAGLRLLHYVNEEWQDVTTSVDVENDIICGAVTSLSPFTILEDIEPPVLSGVPADLLLECSSDVPVNPEVTATDNVAGNVTVEYAEVRLDGDCMNDYVITKTWTASDNFGNTVSQSQVITVSDNTPPEITIPSNVTLECDMFTDPANTGIANAIDNCDVTVTPSFEDIFTADCGNTGVIARTWTATDECGNSSTGVQTITIVDTQAPVIAGIPEAGVIFENDPDQCGKVIEFATGTASDNCSNNVVLSFEPLSGSLFPIGITPVVVTAVDDCENTLVETFDVIIEDTQYPTIEAPTDVVVAYDPLICGAYVTFSDPDYNDNCTDLVLERTDGTGLVSGDLFPPGTTTISYTVTDPGGNSASASFVVIIENQLPILSDLKVPIDPVSVGMPVFVSLDYQDDNLTEALIDWGDENQSFGNIGENVITAEYTYSIPGVYVLNIYVQDVCDEEASIIHEYIVVYDPDKSFAVGGGLIDSPENSFNNSTDLKGIAIFGFVSELVKNNKPPGENSKFYFKLDNFELESTVLNKFIISGYKAELEGKCTINGLGEYFFRLSVVDGQDNNNGKADIFELEVWNPADNELLYQFYSESKNKKETNLIDGSIIIQSKQKKSGQVEFAVSPSIKNSNLIVYPNPFDEILRFEFVSPADVHACIDIFDITGRKVKTIFNDFIGGGVNYNTEFVPLSEVSNTYLYRVTLGESVFYGKVIYKKR